MIRVSCATQQIVGSEFIISFSIVGLPIKELYFAIDVQYSDFVSKRMDSALVALLPLAMQLRTNIYLDGTVSEQLLFNINRYVVPLLHLTLSGSNHTEVTAKETTTFDNEHRSAVITGLSCGIDTFTSVHDYLVDSKIPDSLRITHFIYNDIGSHGRSENQASRNRFDRRSDAAKAVARLLNRPLIQIRSNLDIFYNTPFQQTHTMRNAAIGFLLQGKARYFLYSSSLPYGKIRVEETNDIAQIDPILLGSLSTKALQLHSAGANYNRVEKITVASNMEIAQNHLDVCVNDFPNCSICWKCARTLLTMELLGCLDKFSSVFDLSKYRKVKRGCISHVFATATRFPLNLEVKELYRMTIGRPPAGQLLHIWLVSALYVLASLPGGWRLNRVIRFLVGAPYV